VGYLPGGIDVTTLDMIGVCLNGVTVVLQWRYRGVTVVLPWCNNGVTEALQWCYSGVECGLLTRGHRCDHAGDDR
jgi:hypothetical protein